MTIEEMICEAFRNAQQRGFYQDVGVCRLAVHAEINTELAEASREVMHGPLAAIYQVIEHSSATDAPQGLRRIVSDESIRDISIGGIVDPYLEPKGELVELADVILRIASYCAYMGYDLERAIKIKQIYNRTREHLLKGKGNSN